MKTVKQLIRQPLKTLLGVVLMTLAVAVLCICVGQSLATQSTKKALDEQFSTVAIPSLQEDLEGTAQFLVEDELLSWLQETAQAHPEIIKDIAPNGLLSAYIPQLLPYNTQTQDNVRKHAWDSALYAPGNNLYTGVTHYDSAMLVITLEDVSAVTSPMDAYTLREQMPKTHFDSADDWIFHLRNLRDNAYWFRQDYQIYDQLIDLSLENTLTEGYTVELTGTVTQTVSLPDGLRDPVGMTARLKLTLPSPEDIEALGLVPGQQYIVYGMDYVDDYQLIVQFFRRSSWSSFKHITFDPFDPEKLELPTDQEIRSFLENKQLNPVMLYNFVPLEQWQYDRFNTVSMTLCLPSNLIPYDSVRNEAGEVIDRIPQTEVTYTDEGGQTVTLSMEEYNSRYALPLIAPLQGSAEDFLASPEGAKWQAALDQTEINNHAFSVVGIREMHHLGAFSLDKATIGEGREFTSEEVETGAKVCLVHEWVADQAGLQIGDTISLSFYASDYGTPYLTTRVQELLLQKTYDALGQPHAPTAAREKGLLRPAAGLYSSVTPFTETAEYTIVGFWQGNVWPDASDNYYNFSANTVFVPATSVQTAMEQHSSIPFISVVLENGTIQQFHDLVKRAGYAGRFKYMDQGYSDIAANFHNYETLGKQIMAVGVALYAILLLLFLVLYPSTQRKTVYTMESMGCHYGQRFGHVLLSSMFVMTLASMLGCLIGSALWDRVVAALQTTAETSIALQLEPGVLAMVAVAQLILALVLNILVALFIAAPRGLSARR